MKKLLTIFLCCLMLTPLAACGGGSGTGAATDPQVTASQPVETEARATPGKRYHYDNHCNGGTYIPSTISEAQAMGLTPCKKCAGG